MANTIATPTWTIKEVGRYFVNSLKGVANFNRQYSDEYVQAGAKVGNTVKYRKPQLWAVRNGQAFDQQNILDQTVNIVLNSQRGVDFGFSSAEATHDLDSIRQRYVMPAAETLANEMDQASLSNVYDDVYNSVGTLGTTPSATLTLLQAGVKLTDFGCPVDGRVAVLDPLAMATIANAQAALFHPQPQIGETGRSGMVASGQLGFSAFYIDQNIPRHTSGACAAASTPLVNGAGQTGSSVATDGWGAASAPVAGDIVTFGGVYSVNPISKVSTGRLQQFVLTATPTAGTSITLSISPSIVTSGALQTVTASPADDAVVTFWSMAAGGTQAATVSPQSLIFHPEAFASVMADLVEPNGGARSSFVRSKQLGISIRYVEQFDARSDQNLNRLDILFGSASPRPEWACRMVG